MNVSFEGIDQKIATFQCQSKIAVGTLVKLIRSGTVAACTADDAFFGVVVNSSDKFCGVQYKGYVELPISGATSKFGIVSVAAVSATAVKVVTTGGRPADILYNDSVNLGLILD